MNCSLHGHLCRRFQYKTLMFHSGGVTRIDGIHGILPWCMKEFVGMGSVFL